MLTSDQSTATTQNFDANEATAIRSDPGQGNVREVVLGAVKNVGYDNLDQLLPYEGIRNVVHRSTYSKTGSLVARAECDDGKPRIYGFESSLERAVCISALINPNVAGLKCQPRKVVFDRPVPNRRGTKAIGSNILDFLVTLKNGDPCYLYVKNEETLSSPEHARICHQIRMQLPVGYGFAPISEACFPPLKRGNEYRMFLAKRFPDQEADAKLEEILKLLVDDQAFTVGELVVRCVGDAPSREQGRIFDAILRAVADQKLFVNRKQLVDYNAVLRWSE